MIYFNSLNQGVAHKTPDAIFRDVGNILRSTAWVAGQNDLITHHEAGKAAEIAVILNSLAIEKADLINQWVVSSHTLPLNSMAQIVQETRKMSQAESLRQIMCDAVSYLINLRDRMKFEDSAISSMDMFNDLFVLNYDRPMMNSQYALSNTGNFISIPDTNFSPDWRFFVTVFDQDNNTSEVRVIVIADSPAEAVERAMNHAQSLKYSNILVEDFSGRQVYKGSSKYPKSSIIISNEFNDTQSFGL